MAKRPKPGTPKLKIPRISATIFWEEPKFTLEKNEEMSNLPPAREDPKIIENMTEVDIFYVEEKNVRFYVFQLVLNRLWMRKHPISGRFWNSEDNFEILNLRKR